MNEAALHELLSGRRRDASARVLRAILTIGSWGYSAVMGLRNAAYNRNWLTVHEVPAPVISLGNITTGGTGKTPTAAWLANWLLSEGFRPGLLSRGYRSLENSTIEPASGQPAGNDEKRVLDRLCPGVPHLQQRDRVASARQLCQDFDCNVLILDDGFQHRRLHRDLDLVLIDALQPWGFGHILPRGLLRESLSGLKRADLIVVTRADQCSGSVRDDLRRELVRLRGSAACIEVAFVPTRLIGLDGSVHPVSLTRNQTALSFCGIGNPEGFRQTLATLGAGGPMRVYPDHCHYQPTDFRELAEQAIEGRCAIALTTMKDMVKIPAESWTGPPLYAVEIGVEFLTGEDLLKQQLRAALK
ncbi:MAG: tetraacyldisaccharide 4'-kinase [Planctomycetota bacterium]